MKTLLTVAGRVFIISFVFRCIINILYTIGSEIFGIPHGPDRIIV